MRKSSRGMEGGGKVFISWKETLATCGTGTHRQISLTLSVSVLRHSIGPAPRHTPKHRDTYTHTHTERERERRDRYLESSALQTWEKSVKGKKDSFISSQWGLWINSQFISILGKSVSGVDKENWKLLLWQTAEKNRLQKKKSKEKNSREILYVWPLWKNVSFASHIPSRAPGAL